MRELSFGFDLSRFQGLYTTETDFLNFAKPVYEALATLVHHLCVEEQVADYQAYFCAHQGESGDIFAQTPRQFVVGPPVILF